MNDDNSLEKFAKLSAEIATKQGRLDEELAKRPPSPQAGDIFIFKNPKIMGFQWVVLGADKSQDFSMLPADNNPLVGSNDLGVSDRALSGPLTLRCGYQFRIHKNKFNKNCLRVGILENWDLQSATDKVQEIADSSVRSTVLQQETDSDPDYEEWIKQVKQGVDALAVQNPPPIRKKIGFQQTIKDLASSIENFFSFFTQPAWAIAVVLVFTALIVFWPQKNLIDSSYQTIYAIQTTNPQNPLSLASLSREKPADNVYGFSPIPQASPAVNAFTAGFWTGKETLQGETVTKNNWLDTQWESYFELGRWTFLLESVCKSLPEYRIPQGFWEQQQDIFKQLNGKFSKRRDGNWVRDQLREIGSLLEQLPNQPQLYAKLAEKLKSMREGLTPIP